MSGTTKALNEATAGRRGRVVAIDGGRQVRQKLNTMGVHVGDLIQITRSGIMKGPIIMSVHGVEIAIGRGMADKVLVEFEE